MKFPAATVRAVERLLERGETSRQSLAELSSGYQLGLWTVSSDEKRCVASAALLDILSALPDRQEAAGAVFACEPDLRAAWLRIVAARLKELGAQRDVVGLCQAIDQLGDTSSAVLSVLPQSSLAPTGFAELELGLFGVPAEQAVVTPKLLRAIGATAALVEGGKAIQAAPLPNVDLLNPESNWVRGRLLRLPDLDESDVDSMIAILSGSFQPLHTDEESKASSEAEATMRWVLARPWPLLLAQVVFTQEAWAAERISGGLALEIEESHINRFQRPPQVLVVVTLANGYEVICGSLGELLLRVLSSLGVSVFAGRLTPEQVDDRLAPVVQELLARKVWRFLYSSGHKRPRYQIHETFSDSCYRALGSKYFYRLGTRVTGAIRSGCERWAEEQLARARVKPAEVKATA